jgi:hypothetical protein
MVLIKQLMIIKKLYGKKNILKKNDEYNYKTKFSISSILKKNRQI